MEWLIYPRRDSNPQSPVPKTGALSIALQGLFTRGGTRNHNLPIRSRVLYPIELRGLY